MSGRITRAVILQYVEAKATEEHDEPFEEKIKRLTNLLGEQFSESSKLEAEIRENLKGLGYDI